MPPKGLSDWPTGCVISEWKGMQGSARGKSNHAGGVVEKSDDGHQRIIHKK